MFEGFMMNKAVYYKYMFIIAGLWNILTALIFAILAPLIPSFLPFFGVEQDPVIYLWMYCFLLMVGISGFKYILVGLDITKNHLVISASMISKTSFFIILLVFFILGNIVWPLFAVGAIDLIVVALFIDSHFIPPVMFPEMVAMVSEENDQCVLRQPLLFQGIHDLSQLGIHKTGTCIIGSQEFPFVPVGEIVEDGSLARECVIVRGSPSIGYGRRCT